jgi:hypothetical protein
VFDRPVRLAILSLLLIGFLGLPLPAAADEWQPISPDELKMTSVPEAPGAPAVILYRQVDRDDSARTGHEYNYVRIKILTEQGRKYADVELAYRKDAGDIHSIKGRTVRPDGTIAAFTSKAYDKTIVKAKGLKVLAKTFTMPDVQVGGIIEYHYMYDMHEGYVYDSHWILSDELFTKFAKFTLKPNKDFALRWSWPAGLPIGTESPKHEPNGIVHMESKNIPAFQVEDFMPPENELKFRVDFNYTDGDLEMNPEKFWKNRGKKWNGYVESFIGKRKAMEQAVAGIVSPSDSPEVKLQKLYARVQQVRNTSFELRKAEQQRKREKEKEINNVEDLWKQGYGDGRQINWLFVALTRAAGFESYEVYVSPRSHYFFKPPMMNAQQLSADVVLVKLNGKDTFFDPGSKYAAFGLLPWYETAVPGLRLDKDGGTWVDTSVPESSQATIERKADLKLAEDGALSGKLTVTFSGLEAMRRRTEEAYEDETERKKFLEDQVREYIPAGITVELTNRPDWDASAAPLVTVFDLTIPGWASAAGRRALLPVGLFSATEKQLFEHSNRLHAIYFDHPYQKSDDVTIALPLGWQVSTVPQPRNHDVKAAAYVLKVEDNKGTLHLSRTLRSDLVLLEAKMYPALRAFFQTVRTGDEEQIIVQPAAAAASK